MKEVERVADDFSRIYDHEYRDARASLSKEKHEEEIIYLLMRIVRGIHDMYSAYQSRPVHGHNSTDSAVKDFIDQRLPGSLHKDQLAKPVKTFIAACIKCLSKMRELNDSIDIAWIPKGDVIDTDRFNLDGGKSGQVCDWTVWPAVVSSDGTVVRKGIVTPI